MKKNAELLVVCLLDNATNAILQPDSTITDSLPHGSAFTSIQPYFYII
jgi:hypothetical protein